MNNIYYTYVYCDPRKPGVWKTGYFTFLFEPFYVGEGKNSRIFSHLRGHRDKNLHKANKIQKIIREGFEPIIFKISDSLTGDQALSLEGKLIAELGTIHMIENIPVGPLTNLKISLGGKTIMSEESKRKISQSKKGVRPAIGHSAETRAKISASNKGKNAGKPAPNKGKTSPMRGKSRSMEDIEKIKLGCAKRMPWSKLWLIEFEDGQTPIQVHNLAKWCKENALIPNSVKGHGFHRGIRAKKID